MLQLFGLHHTSLTTNVRWRLMLTVWYNGSVKLKHELKLLRLTPLAKAQNSAISFVQQCSSANQCQLSL